MEYADLTMTRLAILLKDKKVSCEELVKYYIKRIEQFKFKNAVLEVFDDAVEIAKSRDEYAKTHSDLPILFGVPVLIKDNMTYSGHKCSCASKFLKDYVSVYTSSAVQKLIDSGAVIIGRTNMDEFAMGGSTENSAFGVTLNALDDMRVPGGSSGGSAVSAKLGLAAITFGSDTGGSIRQPASFNGVVGLKPTYGRVSRYGLVAYASSLDQIGPIGKSVEDCAKVLQVIAGFDENDLTSSRTILDDYSQFLGTDICGKVFGVPKEILKLIKTTKYYDKYQKLFDCLEKAGAKVIEVTIPHYEMSLPVYYILAPAEATSNLGRFDGVKYTTRNEAAFDISEVYKLSRTDGFGKEVKRRIMLGNFVLSSGYFDAYYKKALKIKSVLKQETLEAFKSCDALIMPTTYGEAFKIGEKTKDPVSMYAEDMFTIFANLVETPAISVPFSKGENGLPLGVQIIGKHFDEARLLGLADYIKNLCKEMLL